MPRLLQAPQGCCRSHLSLARFKSAQVFDDYRERTSGVCMGRMKAGVCLDVGLVADVYVEHYLRPLFNWIEAPAKPNSVSNNSVTFQARSSTFLRLRSSRP